MSISAIVPVWNGRDLLERLLATLAAQTEPAAEVVAVDNGSTDGAPELARAPRRPRDPHGTQRRFRAGREPRHSREPRRLDRRAQQRRGAGAGLLGDSAGLAPRPTARGSPRARSWPPAGEAVWTARSTWCAAAARRGAPATGARMARCIPATGESGPPPGPPRCSARSCFSASGCSKRVSNRTWKTWISGCAAPWRSIRVCMSRKRWRGTGAAPPLGRWQRGNGAPHRPQPGLAAGAALSGPVAAAELVAGSGGARFCGARWPCGTARAWLGCAANGRAGAAGRAPARRGFPGTAQRLDALLRENETRNLRVAGAGRLRLVLANVLSSHRRWGKVTHGGDWNRHRHLFFGS